MANEINIQAALTVQRFTPPTQGSGNLNINQTGTHCIANVQNVGTTAEQLTIVDVATLGERIRVRGAHGVTRPTRASRSTAGALGCNEISVLSYKTERR